MSDPVRERPALSVQVLKLSMEEGRALVDATATRMLSASEREQLHALLDFSGPRAA